MSWNNNEDSCGNLLRLTRKRDDRGDICHQSPTPMLHKDRITCAFFQNKPSAGVINSVLITNSISLKSFVKSGPRHSALTGWSLGLLKYMWFSEKVTRYFILMLWFAHAPNRATILLKIYYSKRSSCKLKTGKRVIKKQFSLASLQLFDSFACQVYFVWEIALLLILLIYNFYKR